MPILPSCSRLRMVGLRMSCTLAFAAAWAAGRDATACHKGDSSYTAEEFLCGQFGGASDALVLVEIAGTVPCCDFDWQCCDCPECGNGPRFVVREVIRDPAGEVEVGQEWAWHLCPFCAGCHPVDDRYGERGCYPVEAWVGTTWYMRWRDPAGVTSGVLADGPVECPENTCFGQEPRIERVVFAADEVDLAARSDDCVAALEHARGDGCACAVGARPGSWGLAAVVAGAIVVCAAHGLRQRWAAARSGQQRRRHRAGPRAAASHAEGSER